MKRKIFSTLSIITLALLISLISVTYAQEPLSQNAGGTAFTYQGVLNQGGSPATGSFDFEFKVYDALSGGTQIGGTIAQTVAVSNGLFSTKLDFGAGVFSGASRYLEIGVRPAGSGAAYTALSPRQELTPVPYAQHADGTLADLSCANGQVAKHDGSSWICGNDNTSVGGGGDGHSLDASDGSPTDVVFVREDGRVGVNTITPSALVEIKEVNGITPLSLNSEGDNFRWDFLLMGPRDLRIKHSELPNPSLSLADTGRVGINTSSPGARLSISEAPENSALAIIDSTNSSRRWDFTTTGAGPGSGHLKIGCNNCPDNVLFFANNGDIGIGKNDPQAKLDVAGTVLASAARVTGPNTPNAHGIQVSSGGDGIRVNATGQNAISVQSASFGIGLYIKDAVTGVYVENIAGNAGYFDGDVVVTGNLSKGSGSFKIDHPLEPEEKYLYHSFVESPDMMNIYNGNVMLDSKGEAGVEMPEWFEALNQEFRYQITAIGAPGPNLYIAEKIENNRFKIAGGEPGTEVSWQVTGIRHDPYAEENRIPIEEVKPDEEQGTYLHPAAYGKPKEMGLNHQLSE